MYVHSNAPTLQAARQLEMCLQPERSKFTRMVRGIKKVQQDATNGRARESEGMRAI